MSTVDAHRHLEGSVESVAAEIGRIVAARQELRAAGADGETLEANRKLLSGAQSQLSQLLIERYLPHRRAA